MEQEHPSLALGPGEDALRADHQGQGLRGRAVSVAALMEKKKKKNNNKKRPGQSKQLAHIFLSHFFLPCQWKLLLRPHGSRLLLGVGEDFVLQPKNSRQKPRNIASFSLNTSPSSNLLHLFNFFLLSLMQQVLNKPHFFSPSNFDHSDRKLSLTPSTFSSLF